MEFFRRFQTSSVASYPKSCQNSQVLTTRLIDLGKRVEGTGVVAARVPARAGSLKARHSPKSLSFKATGRLERYLKVLKPNFIYLAPVSSFTCSKWHSDRDKQDRSKPIDLTEVRILLQKGFTLEEVKCIMSPLLKISASKPDDPREYLQALRDTQKALDGGATDKTKQKRKTEFKREGVL